MPPVFRKKLSELWHFGKVILEVMVNVSETHCMSVTVDLLVYGCVSR